MIITFEEETAKLTEKEIQLARLMAPAFKARKGKENAITSKEIIQQMKKKGMNIDGPRIRKIVHYLVVTGQLPDLIATNKGYCIAETDEERTEYCMSLIQRAASILVRAQTFNCFQEVATSVKQLNFFRDILSENSNLNN